MFDGAHFDIREPYESTGGLFLNRAGETGFNNPKYFTRYFKAAFNVLPSAYAAGKRSDL